MATTWGAWTRVRGTERGFTHSGTFTITTLAKSVNGDWLDFTNFGSITIGSLVPGPSVTAEWDYHPTDPGSPTRVLVIKIRGYSGGSSSEEVQERIPFYGPGGSGSGDTAPGISGPWTVTRSFTFSGIGIVLKRAHAITLPEYISGGQKRQHMHPTDCSLRDGWFFQPNGRVTATCGPLYLMDSQAGKYPPMDPVDDYGPLDIGLMLSINFHMWDTSVRAAHDILSVNVDGVSFNGIFGNPVGGDSGVTLNAGCSVRGAGSHLQCQVADWPVSLPWSAASDFGLGIVTYPPLQYAWRTDAAGFDYGDKDDEVDPYVWAGFARNKYVGGVLTTEPLKYKLSQLPTSETVTESRTAGIITGYGADKTEPDVGRIFHSGTTFQVDIDEFDALNNRRCPQRLYTSEDEQTEQALHDRYMVLDCPGVDGAGGPPADSGATGFKVLAKVTPVEADFFPIAPPKENPKAAPGIRWLQEGNLGEANLGEAEGKYLKWYLDPTWYTEDPDLMRFGGRVSLEIQTRYWDRLGLLKNTTPGISRDWRWPYMLKRIDKPTKTTNSDPDYYTDLFCWKDWAFLTFKINKPKWTPLTLTLILNYAEVNVTDPHYTCEEYRVEEFDYDRLDKEARYTISVPAATAGPYFSGDDPTYEECEVVVSLLCPDSGDTPRMLVGTKFSIDGLYIPRCDHPDKPEAYPGGGYLEIPEASVRFIHDPGWDHTGRDTRALPKGPVTSETWMGSIETWDYQGCWQGVIGDRDGNFAALWWPWEPYKKDLTPGVATSLTVPSTAIGGVNQSASVEQGLGYIEPLKHCPTSELTSQLDYARAYTELGLLGWSDGWQVDIIHEAIDSMTKSFWKGTASPEVLANPYLYWSGCDKYLQQSEGVDEIHFPAAVRVKSWTLARGFPYTLATRKLVFSRTRLLLKNQQGTRILTPDYLASIGEDLRYVVWTEYAYFNKDDEAIAAPSGFPAKNTWHKTKEGTVTDTLSTHGVWASPTLPLRKTRINNPAKSQKNAASQTDYMVARHYVQFWAGKTYEKYDINAENGIKDMQGSRAFRGDVDLGLNSEARLWVQTSEGLTIEAPHRLDAIDAGDGAHVVVHSGALRFAGVNSQYPKDSVVIAYHNQGTDVPGSMLYFEGATNPAVCLDDAGKLIIPCETTTEDYDLTLLRNPLRSGGVEQMTALEGFSHVACCKDPGGGGYFVIAVRQQDAKLCVYRLSFTPSATEPTWTFLSVIGDSDQTTGAIVVSDSWRYTVYRVHGRTIYVHQSTDACVTWTQL